MKVFGLILVLTFAVAIGVVIQQTRTFESQKAPDSYKVLDDLENKGVYQGEDIRFQTIDGDPISLQQYQGKILILSFWATWCEPCVEEFPSFLKLLDTYPDKVVLVAFSHDYEAKDVREFVGAFKGYRPNLVLAMDENKKVSQAFKVDRLPEGFVFDRDGKLVKKIIGIQDWASANALQYFKEL